jgi:superfamily II DNA or RNA helicase
MSDSNLSYKISTGGVEITLSPEKKGVFSRLRTSGAEQRSFSNLPESHQAMIFAIGDLRAWEDAHEGEVEINADVLRLSHDAAASMSAGAAEALGLPQDVDLTLKTDVVGVLGRPDFRLHYEWYRSALREHPKRTGAFLYTSKGPRRLPLWIKRALDLADNFDASAPIGHHWEVLADFRRTLEPDEAVSDTVPENKHVAGLAMTSFLRGLEVRIANRFSISPDRNLGQFEVLPFSSRSLEENGVSEDEVSEKNAELSDEVLAAFQYKLRSLGPRPAYQLGSNSYLVIDRSSAPILAEMARIQGSDREERKTFIQNPRAYITEAVSRHLSENGLIDELDDAAQEEAIEAIAGPGFVETKEFSERVTGVKIYEKSTVDFDGSGTAWLPEIFSENATAAISQMPVPELEALRDHMNTVIESNDEQTVQIGDEDVPVTEARLAAVENVLKNRVEAGSNAQDVSDEDVEDFDRSGPIILDTIDNYEDLAWQAEIRERPTNVDRSIPSTVTTSLRQHQVESFNWAIDVWSKGLPGILNADEQGLGKTLQTIAFLNWLQTHMRSPIASERGPILIVAPTSLLVNWEEEVEHHVAHGKFGHLVRLYGSALSGNKLRGAKGTETQRGLPLLDLQWLDEAIEEGRAHRFWILTTYKTLANYQHSLGRIRFSALVFDEIQNIKNKDTIASKAAEAMNADFRIGLTGTPIENSTMDLWTIMDRLVPGALGSGKEFRARYMEPNETNMTELYSRVFKKQGGRPAIGIRRLKENVAKDLPSKERRLHPRLMPQIQAKTYEEAQQKLAEGGPGASLRMLHHIRSVSVHPGVESTLEPSDFVAMSARLSAVMQILSDIKNRNERALVFIENRQMQFRFAELIRHVFGLNRVDIINGDTPIPKRQAIVNRFQEHLKESDSFDLLILGPKAAGTGLTLTAATNVIHLSRWWNPAVEEQCNDRVHRIGQSKPVTIHIPLAVHPGYREDSFDCLLQSLMQRKRRMANQALWPMGDTKNDLAGLQQNMNREPNVSKGDPIASSMIAMCKRDRVSLPKVGIDGSYNILD